MKRFIDNPGTTKYLKKQKLKLIYILSKQKQKYNLNQSIQKK